MDASIPQFGKWDEPDFPMTQRFENVRKKKSDPKSVPPADMREMEKKNLVNKHPLYPQAQPKPEKDTAEEATGVPPWSPRRPRFAPTAQTQEPRASIPKFGDWERNPEMTLIFDNVRKKKQHDGEVATPKSHPSTPAQNNILSKNDKAKGRKSLFARWLKRIKEVILRK